ncbi:MULTISPECIES: hypothetical protein [Actinomadura]|uniref:Uncharacterized protein n=1 Tax=Actinomadura yumaensis TaxID=111807 RepID=A0ABW2CKW0_9ACTN|nr:hypothetical protein [Actinomadura sp. J1-007]MWK37191.1 hypothetical protein [Actinomadura sp. J1-007]
MARSVDRFTPEQELSVVDQMLREHGGIDPETLGPVVGLLALGITNGVWRNTCIEDWHADGLLHDGDMLRVNSHTTWRVKQRLTGWLLETKLSAESKTTDLEDVAFEDLERLMQRLYRWFTNPGRTLPTGQPLGELAGDRLSEYEDDADLALGGILASVEQRGTVFAFKRAAAHGSGLRWWSHPTWPQHVEAFMTVLEDSGHRHWGEAGQFRTCLFPEPETIVDRRRLRELLLTKPWELDTEAAAWVVSAGLGYAYHSVTRAY